MRCVWLAQLLVEIPHGFELGNLAKLRPARRKIDHVDDRFLDEFFDPPVGLQHGKRTAGRLKSSDRSNQFEKKSSRLCYVGIIKLNDQVSLNLTIKPFSFNCVKTLFIKFYKDCRRNLKALTYLKDLLNL